MNKYRPAQTSNYLTTDLDGSHRRVFSAPAVSIAVTKTNINE